MIRNSTEFINKISFPNKINCRYSEIKLCNEDVEVLEHLFSDYALDKKFDFDVFLNIYESKNHLLSDDVMRTLILCLFENNNYNFTDIFTKKISNDEYDNMVFKCQVLDAIKLEKNSTISVEDVMTCCFEIYEKINNNEMYKSLSKVITKELLVNVIDVFVSNPKKEMNYLIIYSLQDEKLEEIIETKKIKDYEDVLFLIQACLEISKTRIDFAYTITSHQLLTTIDESWDRKELIQNYLFLLFKLNNYREDESIIREIELIAEKFKQWTLDGIVNFLYREVKIINNACAKILHSIIVDSTGQVDTLEYAISTIYSKVDNDTFAEFMLPILSIVGLEKGNRIVSRIEKNLDLTLEKIINEVIGTSEYLKIAIKSLKTLYTNHVIDVSVFEEKQLLNLLRKFHCNELDGFFICKVAMDFILRTSSKDINKALSSYILSSIYDNYFYILDKEIPSMNDCRLGEIKLELNRRKEIRDKASSNPDFKPSVKNMDIYLEKQFEMNRKINKEAQKLSVFYNVFSSQTILYGNKIQYKDFSRDGSLKTKISEMQEMSQSTPIPVRFVHDPLFYKTESNLMMEGKIK